MLRSARWLGGFVPAAKPDGLNSIPKTYKVEGENKHLQVVFWPLYMYTQKPPTNTYRNNFKLNIQYPFFMKLILAFLGVAARFVIPALARQMQADDQEFRDSLSYTASVRSD